MIGLLVYFGVLLLVRTARRFLDRGFAFKFLVRRFAHEPTLDAQIALDQAGIKFVRQSRNTVGLMALLYVMPWLVAGVAGLIAVETLRLPAWTMALALSALIAVGVSIEHLLFSFRGYGPIGGVRPAREWLILGPAVAVRVAVSTLGFLLAYWGIDLWNRGHGGFGLLVMLSSVIPLGVAHLAPRWADRVARRRRPTDFATAAAIDSALLLRSFGDDQLSLVSDVSGNGPGIAQLVLFRTRLEELLSSAMLGEGPLIAIGRPGQSLPELGAARTYVPDEGWQEAVESTAFRAERVIMIAGVTEGLTWEISKLREWGMLQKVLVLVPPDKTSRSEDRIRHAVEELGIENFPYDEVMIPTVLAFGFDSESRPMVYLADGLTWDAYFGRSRSTTGSSPGDLAEIRRPMTLPPPRTTPSPRRTSRLPPQHQRHRWPSGGISSATPVA